ncbi:hypothetical protein M1P97_11825 [Parabacteroides sp. GYB001]|uniref:hypothetical protein n=1 Tax=Parabacteroides leei TaxID=2939491 RepID=UPI002017DE3F|nr:hypothetical protein [Parabacteroides leei]MCL3851978.1 hypothetical protein [Parabacteroides leei]
MPIPMGQPWSIPGKLPVSTAKKTETDPLKRLAPGHERSHIISLLFENALQKTLDTVGSPTEKKIRNRF